MPDQSTTDLSFKTLFEQVADAAWFKQLERKTTQLAWLQTLFEGICSSVLPKQCRLVNIQKDCLWVEVENATQATQLRYRTREILKILKEHSEFESVKMIKARIRVC